MKNTFTVKGITFEIGRHTPAWNEYETGLNYRLYCEGIPTGYVFHTKEECKQFAINNYWIWK